MNHRPLLLPLALLVPLALAACNKPATPAADPAATSMAADQAAPPALADTAALLPAYHWRLVVATDAQGQNIEALLTNADKPVQLDFADGRVAVSNACNCTSELPSLMACFSTGSTVSGASEAATVPTTSIFSDALPAL